MSCAFQEWHLNSRFVTTKTWAFSTWPLSLWKNSDSCENPPPWPQMLKFCKLWGNKDSRYHHHCPPPSPSCYWFPGTVPVSAWPTPLGTQTVHFSRAGEVVSGLHREQGPFPKSNKIKSKRLYILWICFWPLSVSRALGHPGLYCKRSPFA